MEGPEKLEKDKTGLGAQGGDQMYLREGNEA